METKNQHIKETFLAQWLEGNLTDNELKNLVSEKDFVAYKKMQKGVTVFTELEKPLDNSFKNIQNRIINKPKVKLLNLKWIASIAAMLLFFLGFYQFLGSDSVLNLTSYGEQKTIALLDGSEVVLNAKSALNYSKKEWKNHREVFLNGEAFFKVKKGKTFTVKTKNGDITVLGTEFTVKSTPDYFEVICYSGRVKVVSNRKEIVLLSSEFFRKIKGEEPIKSVHAGRIPNWISGESSYKSIPLKYVISDFEKQYNVNVDASKINDKTIFTGSFTHRNLNTALKTIFKAVGVQYKKEGKTIILYH